MPDNNKPTRVIVPFIDNNGGIVAVCIYCEVSTIANCFKTDSMMYYYLLHIYYPIIQYNILHSALS